MRGRLRTAWAPAYQYKAMPLHARLCEPSHLRDSSLPSPQNVQHPLHYSMSSSSNSASSTSSNFETLFNSALEKYAKQTGTHLRDHPLSSKIDSCNSPDAILDVFQEQAQAFDEFRKGDPKLFKWLRPVVNVLHSLSTNEALRGSVSHVSPVNFLVIFSMYSNSLSSRCFRLQRPFSPPSGSFYLCASPSLFRPIPCQI